MAAAAGAWAGEARGGSAWEAVAVAAAAAEADYSVAGDAGSARVVVVDGVGGDAGVTAASLSAGADMLAALPLKATPTSRIATAADMQDPDAVGSRLQQPTDSKRTPLLGPATIPHRADSL